MTALTELEVKSVEKLSQEYILTIVFSHSIEREELLTKKYDEYFPLIKDTELKDMVKEFKKSSREHISLLKDKMIKLKIVSG